MNSQLPPAAKELDHRIKEILRTKDEAVRSQDFEKSWSTTRARNGN